MTLKEAMAQRHTVRKFTDKPLTDDDVMNLTARM